MPTACQGFAAVLDQLLALLMDRRVGNAQLTASFSDRILTALG